MDLLKRTPRKSDYVDLTEKTSDSNFNKCSVITENVGGIKRTYIQGVFSIMDQKNQNNRIYPRAIVVPEVKRYFEKYVKTGRALGEAGHPSCLGIIDFSILSKDGWKEFVDCKIGDEVATLNDDNNIEYQKITNIINEHWKGKIYHFKAMGINSTFTGTHRFYLENRYGKKEVVTVDEIISNRTKYNKHKIIKLGNWDGDSSETIKIGELELNAKAFMGFMGFYLAEGHTDKSKNIHISQNEGTTADEFRELMKELPFEIKEKLEKRRDNVLTRFRFKSEDLYEFLKPLGTCYTKYIPTELKQMSPPLLSELIDWFVKGDGRDQRNERGIGVHNMFSVSKRLIEDLHECLIKSGSSGNWTTIVTKDDYMFADHLIEAKNKSPLYQLNISTTKGVYLDERFLKIEELDHDDNVYCITVPNGNFYMKQNGKAFWTGNSESINLDRVSHRIVNLWIEGNIVYGKALIGGPKGDDIQKILDMGGVLGVSSRSLGSLNHRNEVDELQIMTWDIVHEPSVAEAIMEPLSESKHCTKDYCWGSDKTGFLTENLVMDFKKINKNMLLTTEESQKYAELQMKGFFNALYQKK